MMGDPSVTEEPELLETLRGRVRAHFGLAASEHTPEADRLSRFIGQYYRWVPADDLSARTSTDLFGAALAHWRLAQRRRPGERRLRVSNPDPDADGWASPHSVLEIVTDDTPFLVDSIDMELSRLGYDPHLVIHPMIRLSREADGTLSAIHEPSSDAGTRESFIHVEFDREEDPARREAVATAVGRVLDDVAAAVADWQPMRQRALAIAGELSDSDPESADFLRWLTEDHFTFLGYREYDFSPATGDSPARLSVRDGTGLGILARPPERPVTELGPRAAMIAITPEPLVLTKANARATVHRPAHLDYVGVKAHDATGAVVGERRFLGLYTTTAYRENAAEIPLIRGKVAAVLGRAGFPPDSHDAKVLAEICEAHPRDALFQITVDELLETAVGILGLGERQQVRVFLRPDPLDRFIDCTVCLPRDRYNRDTRAKIGQLLLDRFGGSHFDWMLALGDSRVATLYILVYTPAGVSPPLDPAGLAQQISVAIRAWTQDLCELLGDAFPDLRARELSERYEQAFSAAYQEAFSVTDALEDIDALEALTTTDTPDPRLMLYRGSPTAGAGSVRAKLLSTEPISLSTALDIFAHMGARVSDEEPYEVRPRGRTPVWIYDFGIHCDVPDPAATAPRFAEVFHGVWRGDLENDGLGELVIAADLDSAQITVLRAVAKYLRQAGIAFSDRYIERTLVANPEITRLLVERFEAAHDPDRADADAAAALERTGERLDAAIDAVASLDEDRILRAFRTVIDAVLRTNHYQRTAEGWPKTYLSLKLDSPRIDLLPQPRPRAEIFVYSARVEGVHLRGGAVARGGLRWSDRREDFRTEILGLMKAQMVKNAVIVPVGSKGGFVLKQPPPDASREALLGEGIACYRTFLAGLLDLTDNIVGSRTVTPPQLRRLDGPDPYLVVAADKGTATFSDIANAISEQYGFWLGDAFASGGSVGYDHKRMGITARGAWESVKRHFRELGVDVTTEPITVVGIGDMAGDVFGNGMLLSERLCLVAAFNHQHIFLDPDPDPVRAHAERRRLFTLPGSSWADYDPAAISPGGGVFPRSAKQIPISARARARLGISAESLSPAELVSAILRAPVDLLFNGGIGTYVKASDESDAIVGDRANDVVRIDGRQLRARVVAEGGNLGLTQRGRIEYARGGGRVNTDAIDNVAGVNCSDHEVNIKILLDAVVRDGELTRTERDRLLAEMTDAVADRVLAASYRQTQALSLSLTQASSLVNAHMRLIRHLEQEAGLDRELEHLPSEQEGHDRQAAGLGLLGPELAVLMAHVKIDLDATLLASDLPEDPFLAGDLLRYFPAPLPDRFAGPIAGHRLRREIIATTVANEVVDRQGTTFILRLSEETGADAAHLARAYTVARDVFGIRALWEAIEALDNLVAAEVQMSMLLVTRRVIERAVRWLVRRFPDTIAIEALVTRYAPAVTLLNGAGSSHLDAEVQARVQTAARALAEVGVPGMLADRIAGADQLPSALDVTEVALDTGAPGAVALATHRRLAGALSLPWLEAQITGLPRRDRWEALARDALRDDLGTLHRELSVALLLDQRPDGWSTHHSEAAQGAVAALALTGADRLVADWCEIRREALERYRRVLGDIEDSKRFDTTTLPIALRELRHLSRS